MADTFDPYHRWLSIPPEEQPPHHYRLLGLKLLEDDLDVIESAADRQMTHVRTFQTGKFAEHSQRILNEISSAKVTLLDPARKATYDAPLRAKLAEAQRVKRVERPLAVAQPLAPTAVAAPLPPAARPPTVAPPTFEAVADPFVPASISSPKLRRKKSTSPAVVLALVGVAVVTLAALGAIAAIVRPWDLPTEIAESDPPLVTPPPLDNNNPPPIEPPTEKPPPEESPAAPPVDEPTDEPEDPAPPVDELDEPPDDEPRAPQRSPVPSKAERDAQQAKIDTIFQTAKAKSPAEKAHLAAQLFRTAGETPDDPVAAFVMLNLARELAGDAARMQLAFDAIDLLEQQFDFDADAVRVLTIAQGAKAAVPNDAKQEVVTLGVELANQLAMADKYEDAAKVLNGLVELARRARDPQVAAVLVEHRRVNEALFAAYQSAQGALETLQTAPDDPAANLAVGRFHLLLKNDAARGLTYLTKAENAALAAAAKLELTDPQRPDEQEQLADAWWNLAAQETDKDAHKKLLARSMAWYQRAEPELKGLAAAQAHKRLHELAAAGVQPAEINIDLGVFNDARETDSAAASVDLAAGLVAHWKFDEGDGIIARDSVGGHHGTIRGAAWVKGVRGGALSFDGRDNFVAIPNDDALNFEGPITLSAYVRLRSLPPAGDGIEQGIANILVHGYAEGSVNELYLRIFHRASGECRYEVGGFTGNEISAVGPAPDSDIGVWTHCTATYDGRSWRLYRNGKLVGSCGSDAGAVSAPSDWGIGGHANKGARFFHGDIDDVRIYHRGLSAEEVQTLYLGRSAKNLSAPRSTPRAPVSKGPISKGPISKGLVAHWKFDDAQGAVARDAVGGHDGDVQGATWTKGVRGGALRFDGTDDRVHVPSADALDFIGDITLAAWVNLHSLPSANSDLPIANILAHGHAADPPGEIALRVRNTDNVPRFEILRWSGGEVAVQTPIVELEAWTHLAGVYDGAAWRIYVNGRLAASTEEPHGGAVPVAADWAIGAHPTSAERHFHGEIDDVRIYHRGLSADEVKALYLAR